jgi:hypothetical protein
MGFFGFFDLIESLVHFDDFMGVLFKGPAFI